MPLFGKLHIIKKGNQADDHIFSTLPFIGECHETTFYVKFDKSWIYEPSIESRQDDVNKLFGHSYGLPSFTKWVKSGFKDKFRLGNIHWDSTRFGCRWSRRLKKVELLAYSYCRGVKNWDEQLRYPVICAVDLDRVYKITLKKTISAWFFSVFDDTDKNVGLHILRLSPECPMPSWGFTSSLWFGGNDRAPHDILTWMSKRLFT